MVRYNCLYNNVFWCKWRYHLKRILITGAQGQLGKELYKLYKGQIKYEIIRTDHSASLEDRIDSLDITDELAVTAMVEMKKPDFIINCAAMTAVDLCESEPDKAYQINALGPKYLAQAASKIGATLVQVSTDYVFDGQAIDPYTEDNKTNPISVYGRTKLDGETYVIQSCKETFIIRTAWLYGEGKNFVNTMLRIAENGNKIRVVSDQYGTPTSALELARVIVYLLETKCYGIYHATAEGNTSWYEFAKTIFDEVGLDVSVEAIFTSEYPTPARRPMYSILENKALKERHNYYMKDWKEAFREYIKL